MPCNILRLSEVALIIVEAGSASPNLEGVAQYGPAGPLIWREMRLIPFGGSFMSSFPQSLSNLSTSRMPIESGPGGSASNTSDAAFSGISSRCPVGDFDHTRRMPGWSVIRKRLSLGETLAIRSFGPSAQVTVPNLEARSSESGRGTEEKRCCRGAPFHSGGHDLNPLLFVRGQRLEQRLRSDCSSPFLVPADCRSRDTFDCSRQSFQGRGIYPTISGAYPESLACFSRGLDGSGSQEARRRNVALGALQLRIWRDVGFTSCRLPPSTRAQGLPAFLALEPGRAGNSSSGTQRPRIGKEPLRQC